MASVWYIGGASARTIPADDWTAAGHAGRPISRWGPENGFSLPQTAFTAGQLTLLDGDDEFVLTETDGPRPGAIVTPAPVSTATRGWVQEQLAARDTELPDTIAQAVTEDGPVKTALTATYARPSTMFSGRRVGYAGDSITFGTGASSTSLNYANQATRIAGSARAGLTVNAGVAGNNSTQLLGRFQADVLDKGIDHVHIAIGTNDAGQAIPLATFQANVAAMVDMARKQGVTVSMSMIPPRGSSVTTSIDTLTRTFNLWLRMWCPRQGIPLADTFGALADPATGFLLGAYDSGDGVHPSNAGHLAIAKVVAPMVIGRQLDAPWPVAGPGPTGLLSNPMMIGTTGWADQGGTGTATVGTLAPSPGDGLPAGNWLTYRINNTAGGGSVYRQIGATLDATKYSAGDVLALCAVINHSDPTGAASVKLQLTNGGVASTIPFDTTGSVNNPGPIITTITVPASPTTLRLGMVLSVPAGIDATAYLGAVQLFNLTTGGLLASF